MLVMMERTATVDNDKEEEDNSNSSLRKKARYSPAGNNEPMYKKVVQEAQAALRSLSAEIRQDNSDKGNGFIDSQQQNNNNGEYDVVEPKEYTLLENNKYHQHVLLDVDQQQQQLGEGECFCLIAGVIAGDDCNECC
jgi:hypothetical protein